jgi:mono/diheme cytochrome c family protein
MSRAPRVVVMKSVLLALLVVALPPWNAAASQNPQQSSNASDPGKAIFTGRCGKCHDADASKKLPDGTTLLARLARNKDPEMRLATRLKDEQERHQVFLYLQPMIERERSSATANPKR